MNLRSGIDRMISGGIIRIPAVREVGRGMFYGARTAELTAFARECGSGSRALDALRGQLDPLVLSADWQGADAEALRGSWSARVVPDLQRAADLLQRCADELAAHAEEQDEVSSTDGSGSGGDGPAREGVSAERAWPQGLVPEGILGILGGLQERSPWSGLRTGEGIGLGDLGIAQEMSGIAPGEPDPARSAWEWVLGERDSPMPDLPGDTEKGEGPGGQDPDDRPWDLGGEEDSELPPTEPTKPADWPEDMPWPPVTQAPAEDDGQYVYGDEGYGASGDATQDERPVGTGTDAGDEGRFDAGGGYVEGRWTFSEGTNVTEDEHGNWTFSGGVRGGGQVEIGGGTDDGTGMSGTGTAEGYAEAGVTVGKDGYGVGARAGAEVSGEASYTRVNEDGSTSIYTVEAHAEAGGHASHYGHRVRNGDGEVTGWAGGFDVGGGASAGYSYTEERVAPNGWFSFSSTTSDAAGRSVGLNGNAVISTDEVSFTLGGGIPGVDTGSLTGVSVAINPNQIVEDVSGGAFDADDLVREFDRFSPYNNPALPAWA